jgi:hypothetical protein
MSDKYDNPAPHTPGTRLSEVANAGLALLLINQTGGQMPELVHEYQEPFQIAQADFDPLRLLEGNRQIRQAAMDNQNTSKVEDFGSIQSMHLPDGFGHFRAPADTGYLSLDEAPKLFQKQGDEEAKIGVWNRNFNKKQTFDNLKEIFHKPSHLLTDDEYFKISDIMTPGPWSGNGRGHEISMSTMKVNGKDAVVYDYWMAKSPAGDTPVSKPGNEDIRCRVVFVPNERTDKIDILWMQASNNKFNQREREFENSLKSICWK